MQKKCGKCQTVKDVSEFCENRSKYDGLDAWCRSCKTEYASSTDAKNQPARRRNWGRKIADHLHLTDQDY